MMIPSLGPPSGRERDTLTSRSAAPAMIRPESPGHRTSLEPSSGNTHPPARLVPVNHKRQRVRCASITNNLDRGGSGGCSARGDWRVRETWPADGSSREAPTGHRGLSPLAYLLCKQEDSFIVGRSGSLGGRFQAGSDRRANLRTTGRLRPNSGFWRSFL